MGWLSTIWDAVKSVGSFVGRIVKKVYDFCTSDSASRAYDRLEKMISDRLTSQSQLSDGAPDFYGNAVVKATQIETKISKVNQELVRQQAELDNIKKLTAIQVELARLRASAELIDRSMKNIRIHASSLMVHYQNMRNINGLIDDVNALRHGLKAVISTLNHNANLLSGSDIKLRKIEGINIEKVQGAISQVAAYDAFDRTRELLRNEVIELATIAGKHLNDIQSLKAKAADYGGDLGNQIIEFIDRQIVPIIKSAESAGLLLKSEVSKLPAAVRDESGLLVFENGCIKLEWVESPTTRDSTGPAQKAKGTASN